MKKEDDNETQGERNRGGKDRERDTREKETEGVKEQGKRRWKQTNNEGYEKVQKKETVGE